MKPSVYTTRPRDSHAARLLRAFYSAIIPGVGQLVAGVRRRGFILLGIFLAVSLGGIVILTQGTDAILAWVVQPKVLVALLFVNIIIMLVRLFAVLDAGLTAKVGALKPARRSRGGVLATGAGLALIIVLTVAPHAVAGYYTVVSHNLLTSVFASDDGNGAPPQSTTLTSIAGGETSSSTPPATSAGSTSSSGTTTSTTSATSSTTSGATSAVLPPTRIAGRMTVLLIGSDAGYGRTGARADSMNVATIDLKTGDVAIFGLPRNATQVPLGEKTAAIFGSTTYSGMNEELNSVYTWGLKHPELVPKGGDPGAEAVRETAEQILGIPIDYYAVVNMLGLADMVDAVGGIKINLKAPMNITYAPLGPGEQSTTYHFKTGLNKMNGLEALAYARDRSDSSDYVRMGRQRCVLMALLYQNSATKLTLSFPKLAAAIEKSVKTDIPVSALPELIKLRSKLETNEMISLGFVPPDYISGRSALGLNILDIPLIKKTVRAIIDTPDAWLKAHPASGPAGSSECYKVTK